MKKLLLLLTFIIFSVVLRSQTLLEFYNNTNKDIFAAYAYFDNSNACWVSKGWYKIERYSTASVDVGNYKGNVYIHGEQSTLLQEKSWGSGTSLCVEPTKTFEIRFANIANCKKKKQFSKMMVSQRVNKWTFNP